MIPNKMKAMVLTGHGDIDKLEYKEVPTPSPAPGEVLVQVTATAKNNTDRKAREGLYPTKKGDTTSFQMGGKPTLIFPRIQGADIAGRVVAVGDGVASNRVGERGLLDFNIYASKRRDINLTPDYFGHGADGGYAEYVAVPSDQFHVVQNENLTDAQLAAMGMCSYQTALHMLTSAHVKAGERVLVTGASGGVGTALIQLCRILGAIPCALSTSDKAAALLELGAEAVLDRSDMDSFVERVRVKSGGKPFDAVMDLVGGDMTDRFIDTMIFDMNARETYPRLSIAGAGGGNVSEILWTRIYLYQVQIYGVSHGTREEAEQLVEWIRSGQIKPVLHGAFRLSEEGKQSFFLESPAGLVRIEALVENGVVEAITCEGLPSYIHTHWASIEVPSLGFVSYSVAYSGGFYALVDAESLGFGLTLDEERKLARAAHAIVEAIQAERSFSHYTLGDVGPLPFLHFMGPVEHVAEGYYRSRSATYVHPGVICRSTTGTGTSARLALMNYEGLICPGDKLETVSLRGTSFIGEFSAIEQEGDYQAVKNNITGKAYVITRSDIVVNCEDPLVDCDGLHNILSNRSSALQ